MFERIIGGSDKGDIGGLVEKADEMLAGVDDEISIAALINQMIDQIIERSPKDFRRAKELYLQKHELIKSASGDEIDNLKASVASELGVQEKISFLLHMAFGKIWGQVSTEMVASGDIKVAQKTIKQKMEDMKDNKFVIADGTNLILPSNAGMFGKARKLFGMVTPFLGKDEKGNDRFELLTGATIVLPRVEDGKNVLGVKAVMNFEEIGKGLKPPVQVQVVSPLDSAAGSKPPDNVLRIMYAPREGLPMKGGQVDVDTLRAFADVYKGGETMWFTPEIVAGIKVLQGAAPAAALAFVKIKKGLEGYGTSLSELTALEVLINGGTPAPVAPAAVAAVDENPEDEIDPRGDGAPE